jgi:hypothetical protein
MVPATVLGLRVIVDRLGGRSVRVAVFVTPLFFALIVTTVSFDTAEVLRLNVAEFWPAGIVTDAGTAAAVLLLESVTMSPFGGAEPVRVIVPIEAVPPGTVPGAIVTVPTVAGVTVRIEDWLFPANVAVMVEVVFVVIPTVRTVKFAELWPWETVTVGGTDDVALLLVSGTVWPPAPAGPLRFTVPVDVLPPPTEVGFRLIETRVAGVTVKVAEAEATALPAEIVAVVWALTPEVVTVNVAVDSPAAITTVAGTVALELLDVRFMVAPPVGACPEIVIVPTEELPPSSEDGASVNPVTCTMFLKAFVATTRVPFSPE